MVALSPDAELCHLPDCVGFLTHDFVIHLYGADFLFLFLEVPQLIA